MERLKLLARLVRWQTRYLVIICDLWIELGSCATTRIKKRIPNAFGSVSRHMQFCLAKGMIKSCCKDENFVEIDFCPLFKTTDNLSSFMPHDLLYRTTFDLVNIFAPRTCVLEGRFIKVQVPLMPIRESISF